MATAKIVNTLGAQTLRRILPNGKPYEVVFKEDKKNPENSFMTTVPIELNYVDDWGKSKLADANFARDLLKSYPHLKLVEAVVPDPIIPLELAPVVKTKVAVVSEVVVSAETSVEPEKPRKRKYEKANKVLS